MVACTGRIRYILEKNVLIKFISRKSASLFIRTSEILRKLWVNIHDVHIIPIKTR